MAACLLVSFLTNVCLKMFESKLFSDKGSSSDHAKVKKFPLKFDM